jgi:hypothetical protein
MASADQVFRKPKRRMGMEIIPSYCLHIAGIGQKLGHSSKDVSEIINKVLSKENNFQNHVLINKECIHLVNEASYCFIELDSVETGTKAMELLNKCEVVDAGGKKRVLNVTFAERCQPKQSLEDILVCTSAFSDSPPAGLQTLENFINDQEEALLVNEIESGSWDCKLARRTQQYGYSFNYGIRGIDFNAPTPPIPENMQRIVSVKNRVC